jgi:RimJ/RimL family protein N-acetyltransferase
MKFHIETERLLLRELRPSDDEGMFALDSDPEVLKYFNIPVITSIDEARETIAKIRQQYTDFGIGRWAAIEKSSGEFIGWSGLKFRSEPENGNGDFHDVGYRLIPKYWGKGYATESAKAALVYAFNTMQLQEVVGTCNELNLASRRALEKCGLTFVRKFQLDALTCDWLKITREEWEKGNSSRS